MDAYLAFDKELARHMITEVAYFAPRARYPRLHGYNAIKGYHGFGGTAEVVRLTTNQGASGWASLSRSVEVAKNVEGLLLNKQLTDVFSAGTGILDEALLPYDIALHDLAGRILGIPVSRMINPAAASHVHVYDAAIYMNDLIPEEKPYGFNRVLEDCAHDYALGHRSMKIKIGRSHMWMEHDAGIERDIKIVRAVCKQFPDVTLMVDANDGYSLADCFSFLEGIGDVRLYWFEEPFRESAENNARLKAFMNSHCPQTYIADGESFTDIPLLFDLAGKKLLDIWMPDVCGYGFTAWRKLFKKLVPLGYLGSPHAWGQVLKTHYSAHLAAAYPHNAPYVEGVLGTTEGIDYSGYVLREGILEVPEKPGFGMELEWAPQI